MAEKLNAGDICNRIVTFAERRMSLVEAAKLMREHHVGSLVVVDESGAGRLVVGMLTDRDIVTAVVAKDVDVRALQVGDVMSTDVVTAREGDSLLDTLAVMRRHGVRRVPVTDARGVLQGVLSLDDVTEVVGEQISALVQALTSGRRQEERRRR